MAQWIDVEAGAVVVLVMVTWWYARSTREILRETRRQADVAAESAQEMREQGRIMAKSVKEMRAQAEIMALSALVTAKRGFKQTWPEESDLERLLDALRQDDEEENP